MALPLSDHTKLLLAKLHYSPKWLEFGLIDDTQLEKQCKQYDISDDKNTEHYRFESFRVFLARNLMLDNDLLEKYIELALEDEDGAMGQAAAVMLCEWPYLTDAQLDYLYHHPAYQSRSFQRRIDRTQLLHRLRSSPITDELLQDCIASRDAVVQRELLKTRGVSRQQVETLQQLGATKAIRNVARQKLNQFQEMSE